jgi:glutathione S-transferase
LSPTLQTPLPLLWHFPISHFNEKVRWALDLKAIPHLRRALSLGYFPKAVWATGQGRLPILFLDGKAIGDSTRIIAALEQYKPEPALYPTDAVLLCRALELEDFFDEELGHSLRAAILGPLFEADPQAAVGVLTTGMTSGIPRFMTPAFVAMYKARHNINTATVTGGRAKVLAALDRITAELQPSGYLVGDRFSVADLTAAALFCPIVMPPEFQYRPTGPEHRLTTEYRNSLAGHTGFRWVEDIYRRHRGKSAEVEAP